MRMKVTVERAALFNSDTCTASWSGAIPFRSLANLIRAEKGKLA